MHVLLTGSHGLIGSALRKALLKAGHDVTVLVRSVGEDADSRVWNPQAETMDANLLADADAVIHLAGESVAQRWTPAVKERIRSSRVHSTRLLVGAMAKLSRKPHTFLCASAVGYYGDRGAKELTEESEAGSGFLAEVCQEWEGAARGAADDGVRVVNLRLGPVLSSAGGMLRKMLPAFRRGVGGRVGSGHQYISWISLDDAVDAVLFTLERFDLHGPVNITASHPVTNGQFSRALGRVLKRPAWAHVPATAVRLLMGEMADELLLSSAWVLPQRLLHVGFRFQYSHLQHALHHLLQC